MTAHVNKLGAQTTLPNQQRTGYRVIAQLLQPGLARDMVVCTENLNSDIVTMQATKDRVRFNTFGPVRTKNFTRIDWLTESPNVSGRCWR
jgi:hypothetical protein